MARFASPAGATAAALFGAWIFSILPGNVAIASDDFGYFRSIAETVQHGRPWTDEWLEPWSASFSALAAGLYILTGSFFASTYGFAAVLAAISFWATSELWRERGISPPMAILATAAILTTPTVLWKEVDFTGVMLHLPCLLLAIILAERGRWGWFAVVTVIGLANRQSAAIWLAIPATGILSALWREPGNRRGWLEPLGAIVAGLAAYALLSLAMNKTQAQSLVTDHLFGNLGGPQVWRAIIIASILFLVAAGIGSFVMGVRERFPLRALKEIRWWQVALVIAGSRLFYVNVRPYIFFEHPGFDYGSYSSRYFNAVIILSLVGWLRPRMRLDWKKAAFALAAVVPLALRNPIWDYYLIDIGVFGLLGCRSILPAAGTGEPASSRAPRLQAAVQLAVVAAVLYLGGYSAGRLKIITDQNAAICRLAERAIREGKLLPTETAFTNIGFEAWYLERHFITHEGRTDPNQVGFIRYRQGAAVAVSSTVVADGRPHPGNPSALGADVHRLGWFGWQETVLSRTGPKPAELVVASDYAPMPLPLDDREWTDLILRRGLWRGPAGKL